MSPNPMLLIHRDPTGYSRVPGDSVRNTGLLKSEHWKNNQRWQDADGQSCSLIFLPLALSGERELDSFMNVLYGGQQTDKPSRPRGFMKIRVLVLWQPFILFHRGLKKWFMLCSTHFIINVWWLTILSFSVLGLPLFMVWIRNVCDLCFECLFPKRGNVWNF